MCIYIYIYIYTCVVDATGTLCHPGEPTVRHSDGHPRHHAHQRQRNTVKQTEFSHTDHPGESANPSGSSIFLYTRNTRVLCVYRRPR